MEWIPPEGQLDVTHRSRLSRPTTGSPSRCSSTNKVRGAAWQECTAVTVANGASSCRLAGKRPRTTSSIFATAANGMLTGLVAPTAVATASSFAEQHAGRPKQQTEALFSLRGHMGAGRVSASATSNNMVGSANDRVVPGGTAVTNADASITAPGKFRSNAAGAMILDESSYRDDALGEAAAMAADERRSSPPAPPPERSIGYHRDSGKRRHICSPQPTLIDDNLKGVWSQDDPFNLRAQTDSDDCIVENRAVASSCRFIDTRHHGSSSPTAPAYEPSPSSDDNATTNVSCRHVPERHLESRAESDDFEQPMTNVLSSRATNSPSQGREVERDSRVEIEGSGSRHTKSPHQRGDRPPSPTVNRQNFFSTMKKSDDAYHSVREDLLHYMEGVRARMSEDGTPSVTFPRNFDRIVGLMGRSELEDQAPPEELKVTDNNESGKMQRNQEDRGKERGKGQGRRKPQGDLLPPWTKYLLEEGLDRTKAFSRYRGMFADEQTGEDRVMRGLAKMRELDLRLARTTERARELKIMAHQAAEQAERAAARVETDSKRTSPRHPKGRGPVAVEDVTSNNPRLRLPLPLSSGTSPFGAISSRVSNGSARQMGSGGGGGTGLGTQRSEMSEASGSQAGADGTGSSNRDGQARGGRAFVTQNFRGAGNNRSISNSGSASASVDGSEALTSAPASSGVCRLKNKFDALGDSTSRGRASSGGGDGGYTGSNGGGGCGGSGGSSGVSFVLKNKRHAARAGRRRLTDEQESLVSRFLQDADGFNENGEPTGEQPSGVWAEIALYGGAGASDDSARLAEINAKLLAIGGVNVHVLADRDEEQEDDNAVQEGEHPRQTATENNFAGVLDGASGKTSPPPPPPPPSRSHVTTGPPPGARGDPAPGEAALREQRERREARCKERAIDNALEQLRDSLFQTSTADGRNLREEAVDTALELARSAPLDMQGGIRQGAGRIESLLGGDGPQPVGEWEVKHALRLGEEELQGKDLASREKIEELLVTVRQQSAADSRCASLLQRRVSTSDDFPQGTTLDAAFSLTGAARSDAEDGSADIPASCASPVDSSSSPSSAKGGGPMDAAETALKQPQKADGNILVSKLPSAKAPRSAERARPSTRKETEPAASATSTTAGAEGPGPVPRPLPRLPPKEQPSSAVPPELTALFRAPLLVPRHLDPPVAGIAAAAVASGGANRAKPRKRVGA